MTGRRPLGKKVLLCGDPATVIAMGGMILARVNLGIEIAWTPGEALAKAVSEAPDVVVLDLESAQFDGLAVCSTLRAEPRTAHIPIVGVVDGGGDELVEAAYRRGCNDHLTRPLTAVALHEKLGALLGVPMP